MLKEHYLMEDWPQMLDEIENIMNTSVSILNVAENASFEHKNEQLAKMNRSLEILQALHRKKINREIDNKAALLVRDWF